MANKVKVCWVPDYMDIPGNVKADELARAGSYLSVTQVHPEANTPLSTRMIDIEFNCID